MLEGLQLPSVKRVCKVATVLESLTDNDKVIFSKAVADVAWPILQLCRELNKLGVRISPTPITSHRAKSCGCFA